MTAKFWKQAPQGEPYQFKTNLLDTYDVTIVWTRDFAKTIFDGLVLR